MIIAILSAFILVFSLGLLSISVRSYRHTKNQKLMFITGVFLIFVLKGVFLTINVFYPELLEGSSELLFLGIDVVILFLLFIATLKR